MNCEVLCCLRLKGHNLCSFNVFQWDTVLWAYFKITVGLNMYTFAVYLLGLHYCVAQCQLSFLLIT